MCSFATSPFIVYAYGNRSPSRITLRDTAPLLGTTYLWFHNGLVFQL